MTAPFGDLVDESFDEAAFLWTRWEQELSSLTRNVDEVWSWTEDRLHGALDGVRIGGAAAIDVATQALLTTDVGRITAGAAVLGSSTHREATDAIAAALGFAEGAKLAAILRALEVAGSNEALRAAAAALVGRGAVGMAALCRLKAFRRLPADAEIVAAFKSGRPDVQVEALRAAGGTPSPRGQELLAAALASSDVHVRAAAVESGMGGGLAEAWPAAQRFARQLDAGAGPYLKLLAMFGRDDERDVIDAALRIPELQRPAIWALGHVGTSRAVEMCLAGMQHETLARACGEAYAWITGANLERDRLAARDALAEAPRFEDDDLDANLVPPLDEWWPLPDVEAVQKDWAARRATFADDVRYVQGRPVSASTLVAMVETGPMLRRADVILELRVRSRGSYDVEPRAFVARQKQMMAASRAALFSAAQV